MSETFPGWDASSKHAALFRRFLSELQLWCRNGREPVAGNQDIKYFLDLQEHRLKQHRLSMRIQQEPEGSVCSSHQISASVPLLDALGNFSAFNQSTYFQGINQTVEYSREGRNVYKRSRYVSQYQIILDPKPGSETLGSSTYVCPNCGAISTLQTLQDEGCPYCGTHYLMQDLYPKVTNFYNLENPGISEKQAKNHKGIIFGGGGIMAIFGAIHCFLTEGGILWLSLAAAAMGFVIGSIMMYFLLSIFLLFRVFFMAGKSMKVLTGSAGSKEKITNRLRPYDPAFSYEYFEGRALSLARMMIFHGNPQECPQFQGNFSPDTFADVIDVQYRGGFGVRSVRKQNGKIEAALDLYLTNTVDNGRKIKEKDETVRLEMYHRADFPVDAAFSIMKVQCPHCRASFDARKTRICPYCQQEYDIGTDDWVVTGIRRISH